MKFRLWQKHGKTRLYMVTEQGTGGPFFDLSNGKLSIAGGDSHSRQPLVELVNSNELPSNSVDDLVTYLKTHGHSVLKPGQRSNKPPQTLMPSFAGVDIRTPSEIALQTQQNSIEKTPFTKRSLKELLITIDSREPAIVHDVFSTSPLNIERNGLPVGDICVSSNANDDQLIFERKTVSDLYSSVINTHMHSQAERLFEWQQSHNGRSRVIWLIEGELQSDGARGLYNALPQPKQVDGLINYWIGVLGQYVIQSYTPKHSAYLIHKVAQGFFEHQLPYPVKSNNGNRVDVPARARQAKPTSTDSDVSNGTTVKHGVSISGRDTLFQVLCAYPSINSRVAAALMALDKPLHAILSMPEEELLELEGVGKKTAAAMAKDFAL
ncbi:MAG: hypothetical protein CMF12_05995 [Idiomarina sp.]|uniref:ERCC4 domain-containing protein n=1 Tax=Idiomarina sp. TaxID=1874361 RepID=UPI000C3D74C3|nr:ERCC4 domain-containing protein [Idiomarina sp.]MBT42058.1 hypothetical protein [Idiomarina sp.]